MSVRRLGALGALGLALLLILGATPAPPETPRPGHALVESCAAVMATAPRHQRRPESLRARPPSVAAPHRAAACGTSLRPAPLAWWRPATPAFLLLRRTSQGPPERA